MHARQVGDARAPADVEEDARRRRTSRADANRAGASKRAWPWTTVQPSMPRSHFSTPLRESPDTCRLAPSTRCHVDADGTVDHDAVFGGAARQMRGIGAGDQRLGRRAAGVDAGAAEQLALDDATLHAGGRQARRERRAGLAGADDDGVEVRHQQQPHCDEARADDATASSMSAAGRSLPKALASAPRAARPPSVPITAPTSARDQARRRRCHAPGRRRRPQSAPVTRRAPNWTGTVRLGVLGS